MRYAITSAINLAILLVGIAIGLSIGASERSVSAQQKQPEPTPTCVDSAMVECITPIMTVGSAGIGKLVTNQIATDQLTVNGYDILKLQNNVLGVMIQSHLLTNVQASGLAEASRPDKQLRYQPHPPPPPPNPVKP